MESLRTAFPIEEENSTGSGEVYQTPNAFRKKVKEPDDDVYSNMVEDMYERTILEVNYKDFKLDNSKTDKQKINDNIDNINKMLTNVEQMINHASKLKNESGADQTIFWKGTLSKFQRIDQKLNRLSTKIREFNT